MRILLLLVYILVYTTTAYTKPLTEENVRSFLRENPDIILNILREHSVELVRIVVEGSEKEAKEELENQINELKKSLAKERTKKAYPIITKNRPFLGTQDAPVSLVAYSDFLCPYCANSAKTLSLLLSRQPNVKYIFKAYTKNPLGQLAYAVFLTLWTKNHDKAFEFYSLLFSNQEQLLKKKKEYITQVIEELGYNSEQILSVAESSAIQEMLKEDIKEGNALHIIGTPTLIINGKYTIIGAVPLEVVQYAIEYAQKYP